MDRPRVGFTGKVKIMEVQKVTASLFAVALQWTSRARVGGNSSPVIEGLVYPRQCSNAEAMSAKVPIDLSDGGLSQQ